MKHLDLFSGIGGFAYAIDQVWDAEHIFCEIDPFCQKVLQKHWPDAQIYKDIRHLNGSDINSGEVFILTGGFPCQPFSHAGERKGVDDNRYLWPEMLRVIRETKPTWVVAENVRGLLSIHGGMVFEQVCADLENEGYDVQPFIIPAAGVNAPHKRDRIWFIANSRDERLQGSKWPRASSEGTGTSRPTTERDSNVTNPEHEGYVWRSGGRISELDGMVSGVEEREETRSATPRRDEDATNSAGGQWKQYVSVRKAQGGPSKGSERDKWKQNWVEVATRLCRMDDGLPRRMDRTNRLKALGNAIVPQIAVEIFKAIDSA